MSGTSKIIAAAVCGLILCVASPVFAAGELNGNAAALPGWTGSVGFDNGSGLTGTLDYAVFTASAFNGSPLSGLGYVPADALVYTYQLHNTGSPQADAFSAEIVGVVNPASAIGAFDIGDVAPTAANFVSGNAVWSYDTGVHPGEWSWGMAFSSPNLPMEGASLTIDGGSSVLATGIPTPGSVPIPEPTSLLLWLLCSGMIFLPCRRMG